MRQWILSKTDPAPGKSVFLFLFTLTFALPLFAQNSINVSPENPAAQAASLYKLDFVLPDDLPPLGGVTLQFPAGFDLSKVKIAASSVINGGMETFVSGQQVLVLRKGEGRLLRQGEKVDLLLTLVGNPADSTSSYALQAAIYPVAQEVRTQMRRGAFTPGPTKAKVEGTFQLGTAQ